MQNEFSFNIDRIYIVIEKDDEPGFCFDCNKRKNSGFIYVTNGSAVFMDFAGNKSELQKGDIIFLWQNEKYKIKSDKGFSYIVSALDFFAENNHFISLFPKIHKCSSYEKLLITETEKIWQSGTFESRMQAKINMMQLYLNILKENGRTFENTDETVLKAVEYINQNYKTDFSAENVAKHCAVSSSGLRLKFQKELGLSISEYREKIRIDTAKSMLLCGSFSITETAYELGYCDVSHFSKSFKKREGLSPKAYVIQKNNH